MTRAMCETLEAGGYQPVVAHYEPYSLSPQLSAPLHRLFTRKPGVRVGKAFDRFECHAVGAWLPELEFTHYRATSTWRRLVEEADVHLVASGNCLAGTAFADIGVPFLGWIATKWDEDRRVRAASFPAHRRLVDAAVSAPIIRRLEQRILSRGHVLALSAYTQRQLGSLLGAPAQVGLLWIPLELDWFAPRASSVIPGRIGFAARYNDPRKNVGTLMDAFDRLPGDASLALTGDAPGPAVLARRARAVAPDRIELLPLLARREYRDFLQSLDVFVVPSDQEGLCIAALEAMACGCPVVSTRCGGPEEFVVDGETGYLTGNDPGEIAGRVEQIMGDRPLRTRLGANARLMVAERYTRRSFERGFWGAFSAAFTGRGIDGTAGGNLQSTSLHLG